MAETQVVNVRWSGVACNVVPCGLVKRCEQRSASGVGGGVHGAVGWEDEDSIGKWSPLARPRHFVRICIVSNIHAITCLNLSEFMEVLG